MREQVGNVVSWWCPYLFKSELLGVVKEGAKQTAVEMIQDGDQQMLVKLKGIRELKVEFRWLMKSIIIELTTSHYYTT